MILTVDEALRKLNIPIAKHKMVSSAAEAERIAKKYRFPVVLKLVSPRVVHKTEAGGVQVARSAAEVKEITKKFLKKGKVLVQEHCGGVEMFVGIKNDRTFGHVLLAGIGGIFVEVYKDIAFRVCPVTRKDAKEMLGELKGKALLGGVRGKKPVDRKALIDAMVRLSKLPGEMPKIEELDVNPLFASERGVKAADARFVLKD